MFVGFHELQNENSLMKNRIIQLEMELGNAANNKQSCNSAVMQHPAALSLITICLHAYTYGASVETILNYVIQFRVDVDYALVQSLLQNYSELFAFEEERKLWRLILFDK